MFAFRINLPEFNESRWTPQPLKAYITEMVARQSVHPFRKLVPVLAGVLRDHRLDEILDLASGSGGPLPPLHRTIERTLGRPITLELSDLNPRYAGSYVSPVPRIRYRQEAFDARNIPDGDGLVTMFNVFHHFPPGDAEAVLRNCASRGRPILIGEVTHRHLGYAARLAATSFIEGWADAWRIKPRQRRRLLLSLPVPLGPLCLAWDTLASCLRGHDLAALADRLNGQSGPAYRWSHGRFAQPINGILTVEIGYLLGQAAGAQ